MTDLVETPPEWVAGIYQLETNDPVLGGADGIDNLQATQLAKRTTYLKQQIESAQDGLAAHEAAADPHPVYLTHPEGDTKIAEAVAALVAASPSLLDTLNELAAALGNDPNFATTISALLAGKQPIDATLTALAAVATTADKLIYATGADTFATTTLSAFIRTLLDDADAATALATLGAAPLASPALTGTPTAPTPAQFDSTTKVATSEFVKRALGSNSNFISVSGASTLTPANAGQLIQLSGGVSYTTTLPLAVGVSAGTRMEFINSDTSTTQILARQGVEVIYTPLGASLTSVTLKAGETLVLESYGTGAWFMVEGTVILSYAACFAASRASSGYQKLPGGLIIQWGSASCTGLNTVAAFPIAFPSGGFSITGSEIFTANPRSVSIAITNPSQFTFTMFDGETGSVALDNINYIAIGN